MASATKRNPVITNVEIIEDDSKEVPLEKVIDNTLVKHNVTEAVISSLKEKYGGLKLVSLTDKESYLEIKAAKKEVRKWGILTEQLCEEGRADAIKIQKLWLSKQKEILGKIAEVEDPLAAEIKKFDDEVERIEEEKIKKQEEAYMTRQAELLKMGAVYANGCFNLNHVSIESNLVKESDEDIYINSILPKFRIQYEKNEAEKVEQERQREERDAEMKRQQQELARQQEQFRLQQEAFQKQQSEAERIKREEEEKKYAEIKAKKEAESSRRIDQLIHLGMRYNPQYSAYVYQDVNIDVMTELKLWSDEEWNAAIAKITPVIADRKIQEEEKQKAAIELEKQKAIEAGIKAERERIEEEQRLNEIKRQQEESRKAEELAQASDTVKYVELIKQFNAISIPEMRSGQYRKKVSIIREKLEEIKSL